MMEAVIGAAAAVLVGGIAGVYALGKANGKKTAGAGGGLNGSNKVDLSRFATKDELQTRVPISLCERIHADETKLQGEREKRLDEHLTRINHNLDRIWARLDSQQ